MPTPGLTAGTPGVRKLPNLSKPTKIVCLKNMVSKEEIDEELSSEVTMECAKYGNVIKGKLVAYIPEILFWIIRNNKKYHG